MIIVRIVIVGDGENRTVIVGDGENKIVKVQDEESYDSASVWIVIISILLVGECSKKKIYLNI